MYPHFIEVHAKKDAAIMSINIDNIVGFGETGENSTILTSDNGRWVISESYDELKELISNAGASINKGDPRLDQTKPLTMKDLEEMKSGEPVWDSNRNEWYLLRTMTKDGEVWFSDFIGRKVIATEEMLIKTPLYRMKRNEDRIYIPDGYVREKLGSKNHD